MKRYQAQTVHEALRAVREDLGPDALVVSTRMVAAPGPRGWFGARLVQVTAAEGRTDVPEFRHATAPTPTPARLDDHPVTPSATAGTEASVAPAAAIAPPARRPSSLRRFGRAASQAGAANRFAVVIAGDQGYAPIELFVGPPGVGKTMTIAKIAAQERARHGHRLGLIATDVRRVGAVEQLRLYAQIIGAPLTVARSPYELQTAVETADMPVLVDTAGRSARDEEDDDMCRVFAGRRDVRTHLVVAADTPLKTLRALVERFDHVRPTRLVLTRLDEAESLASVMTLLEESGLRLSYLGTGQRVPDDLEMASPRALAAWMARTEIDRGAAA